MNWKFGNMGAMSSKKHYMIFESLKLWNCGTLNNKFYSNGLRQHGNGKDYGNTSTASFPAIRLAVGQGLRQDVNGKAYRRNESRRKLGIDFGVNEAGDGVNDAM